MHVDQVRIVVGHEIDPVVHHTVSAGAILLQVLDVAGRVDELQPPGDPEQRGPAGTGGGPGSATIAIGVTLIPLDRRVRLWNR